MKGHARDARAKTLRCYRDLAVGMNTIQCSGCDSTLTFGTNDRPETCHLCGTALPAAETVKASAFDKSRCSKATSDAYLAGMVKRFNDQRSP